MGARPVDDVMEFMRQYATHGAAEQQVAIMNGLWIEVSSANKRLG